MEPILMDGDIVFYKKYNLNKSKIKSGDIVIFNHPVKNFKLIKKVSKINNFGIEVSGENKNFSKDSNFFGLINKERIIGIVTSHISYKSINRFKMFFNL